VGRNQKKTSKRSKRRNWKRGLNQFLRSKCYYAKRFQKFGKPVNFQKDLSVDKRHDFVGISMSNPPQQLINKSWAPEGCKIFALEEYIDNKSWPDFMPMKLECSGGGKYSCVLRIQSIQ
jgi:hypothetical protein